MYAAAAIADWTREETKGRSSTLGRSLVMGMAEAFTEGTPMSEKVTFLTNGAESTICSRSRTVPAKDSTAIHYTWIG